jgi:hypothetical protein
VKLYAKTPARRHRQIALDVTGVVWTVLWVTVAVMVYRRVASLADSLRGAAGGGTGFADNLRGAADQAAQVPLVGSRLSGPISSAADTASTIASGGYQAADSLVHAGLLIGIVLAAGPILLFWLGWLPGRVRFARNAAAGQRFVDANADLDLFALRAMAAQPLHVLARISSDPVAAWRAGDRRVITELATLELGSTGLKPPQLR